MLGDILAWVGAFLLERECSASSLGSWKLVWIASPSSRRVFCISSMYNFKIPVSTIGHQAVQTKLFLRFRPQTQSNLIHVAASSLKLYRQTQLSKCWISQGQMQFWPRATLCVRQQGEHIWAPQHTPSMSWLFSWLGWLQKLHTSFQLPYNECMPTNACHKPLLYTWLWSCERTGPFLLCKWAVLLIIYCNSCSIRTHTGNSQHTWGLHSGDSM